MRRRAPARALCLRSASDVARVLNAARGPSRFLMFFERGGVMYRTDFVIQ